MSRDDDKFVTELTAAADGLLYPSESDEPFELFVWPASDGRTAKQAVMRHTDGELPIISQSADTFFRDLTGSDDAERFGALQQLLERELIDLQVYRVGETQVDVYVIGRCPSGWIGVRTRSIET